MKPSLPLISIAGIAMALGAWSGQAAAQAESPRISTLTLATTAWRPPSSTARHRDRAAQYGAHAMRISPRG